MGRADLLVVFTRWPEVGVTKTRLAPALGPAGAAALQAAMTRHVIEVAPAPGLAVAVRHAGGRLAEMRAWLGDGLAYAPQGEGDLGARMARAFEEYFAAGWRKVLVVGADCPEVDSGVTQAVFAALDQHDAVLGPAADGGYYLIGLRRGVARKGIAALFADTPWGTDTVRAATLARAARLGLSVSLLGELRDVDVPADLPVWEMARARQRISVVIPALNEAAGLAPVLARVFEAENVEAIVVDGGSKDDTALRAAALGARVVHARRGRARQLNAGAAEAEGGILLFLHADTLLPRGWAGMARRELGLPGTVLGAYRFRTDGRGWAYRYIEWTAWLRCRFARMPYGDQGLFLRRETFGAAGGFPELPVMEDYALVRALRRQGRVVTVSAAALTSARRWKRHGVWRTTALHVLAYFAFPLGVSPARIARWLGRGAESPGES